jgi:hypothetical protein
MLGIIALLIIWFKHFSGDKDDDVFIQVFHMWEPPMGTSHRLPKPVSRKQVGKDLSGNQPDQLTLWLHRASLNNTPHRASLSEEQHSQQSFKQQRRQPTSTYLTVI